MAYEYESEDLPLSRCAANAMNQGIQTHYVLWLERDLFNEYTNGAIVSQLKVDLIKQGAHDLPDDETTSWLWWIVAALYSGWDLAGWKRISE